MIRLFFSCIMLAAVTYGAWWAWTTHPEIKTIIHEQLETGNFLTLEARYSPEQIMETQASTLLKGEGYNYLRPSLYFSPYLLMEVKYTNAKNMTGEGQILWGQGDGEMVINTRTWETSHGFEDCINAKAGRTDYKLINVLSKLGGSASREDLLDHLYVESRILDKWLEDAKEKHLIVQTGNLYRLHFEKPRMLVSPETQVQHPLVTKPYKGSNRLPRKYSESVIRQNAQAAFGKDFAIRTTTEVFLPVYSIRVKNPDGTTLTSYWNALTQNRQDDL